MWQRIASELDDADNGLQYPEALRTLTVDAPAGTWNKIRTSLDQEETLSQTAGEKLLALEITPPARAWQQIAASLDTEAGSTPITKKPFPLFRYAAAAAITGLLAWGGIALFSNKPAGSLALREEQAGVQPGNNKLPEQNTPATLPENNPEQNNADVANAAEEARNDAALEQSKQTFARLDVNTASKIKAAADFYFAEPEASANTRGLHIGDDNDVPQYTPTPNSEPSRYIMLMTPDGNIIRMSKKLSDLVCCVSGEEQDKACREQMQKWREKLACSPATHSPGNFMDILSLAHALQQDNQ